MKKLIWLPVLSIMVGIALGVILTLLAVQLGGCDSTESDEVAPVEVVPKTPSAAGLFADMWLEVAQTCSAEGYRTAVKHERCLALEHASLVVVRSKDGFHLLRYEQRSDIVEQDPDSLWNFCPPGTLTVMSKEDFEAHQRLYEKEFRKRQATDELLRQQ